MWIGRGIGSKNMGFGVIIRDNLEESIVAFVGSFENYFFPLYVEFVAVREGLVLVAKGGIYQISSLRAKRSRLCQS